MPLVTVVTRRDLAALWRTGPLAYAWVSLPLFTPHTCRFLCSTAMPGQPQARWHSTGRSAVQVGGGTQHTTHACPSPFQT